MKAIIKLTLVLMILPLISCEKTELKEIAVLRDTLRIHDTTLIYRIDSIKYVDFDKYYGNEYLPEYFYLSFGHAIEVEGYRYNQFDLTRDSIYFIKLDDTLSYSINNIINVELTKMDNISYISNFVVNYNNSKIMEYKFTYDNKSGFYSYIIKLEKNLFIKSYREYKNNIMIITE